jgi:glycosyltransferase involved in cell wall biosynthesis
LKKIILTVTNDLSYDQRMHRVCNTLSKAGYEVLLVGRKRNFSIDLKEKPYGQKRINCWFENGKFFYIEYNIRLFLFLLFTPFDIVNANDLDTILPCFFVSKMKGKNCIYDAHEYFTEVPEILHRPFTKKIWETLERFVVPRLKHCYTVSESIAILFQEKYKTTFDIIRNVPVLNSDNQFLYKYNDEHERYIIYQGALNQGRGLECLIESMQWIDCHLYLVGEGDLSEELRVLAQKYKVKSKVKFMGYIEPNRLPNITNKAFLGINVSDNLGLSYYYSLNNKCFDYIHAGIPSVTNNFPEYIKINEQYQVAVLTDLNAKNLASSVNLLLNDRVLYNKLKANCLLAREEYNWQNEEQKLLEIYKRIA